MTPVGCADAGDLDAMRIMIPGARGGLRAIRGAPVVADVPSVRAGHRKKILSKYRIELHVSGAGAEPESTAIVATAGVRVFVHVCV